MSLSRAIYGEQIGHLKWDDLQHSLPEEFDRLIKFAVCRDPFDRFVSAFDFLKSGGVNEADQRFADEHIVRFQDASEFALALRESAFLHVVQRKVHFHTQFSFVCRPDGEIMVDHLIVFNRLAEDVPLILPPERRVEIPHVNKTQGRRPSGDQLSTEARKVVAAIYGQDIALMAAVKGVVPVRGKNLDALAAEVAV